MSTTPGPNPLLALTPSQVNWAQSEQWKQIVRQALVDVRCASPGFLTEDMDVVTQTATVQIALQERVRAPNVPKAQWWDIPPIVFVPVMMPRGGGYAITLPLKKGDEGMLIFCDTCIDLWWKNGQSGTVADNRPNSGGKTQKQNEIRRHYVHDCGFYPGLWNQKRLLENYSVDSLQIRSDDGATYIDLSVSGVKIVTPQNFTLNTDGDVNITVGGVVNMVATGDITIEGADVTITPLTGGSF